jgi:hypothetical protein
LLQKNFSLNATARDLRDMTRHLEARAAGIMARLNRDPILRALAVREAARCRRLAEIIALALGGIG